MLNVIDEMRIWGEKAHAQSCKKKNSVHYKCLVGQSIGMLLLSESPVVLNVTRAHNVRKILL